MKKSRLVLFVLVLFSNLARADWEADFTAVSSKESFPKVSGKFYSKQDQFRIDSGIPFDMSVYARGDSSRVTAAVHSFRIRLSSKPERFSGQLPACLSKNFELCTKELNLKKVGSEGCDGRQCDVYEGSPKVHGFRKVRLWHWSGEKEPIFARSIITKSNGEEISTSFTKIVKRVRPATFFIVPPGYKDAGSLEDFINGFKGDSP